MNYETNQTFVYDGYTATATCDAEAFRTNMTYDEGVNEPIIFELPRDFPEPRL
jgi:hypothetical protein